MKETKEKIINTAIQLLKEDTNCSLEEIANKAGISRRTLHRYFNGKEELILQVFENLCNQYLEGFLEIIRTEKDALETLKSLLSYDLHILSTYGSLEYIYESFNSKYNFEEELLVKIKEESFTLGSKLIEEGHFDESIDQQWLEAYYDSLLELGTKQIKHGIDIHIVEATIWKLFLNGISK